MPDEQAIIYKSLPITERSGAVSIPPAGAE
jgi:hypothetical protein